MKNLYRHALGQLGCLAIVGAMTACSSTTTVNTTGTPADAGADTSTTPTGSTVADGGKDTGKDAPAVTPDPEPTDPDEACAEAATQQECANCFATNHSAGYQTFQDAVAACGCQTGAQYCSTPCAGTFCPTVTAQPSQACLTCLQGTLSLPDGGQGVCVPSVSQKCQADSDCLAYIQGTNSVCANKP